VVVISEWSWEGVGVGVRVKRWVVVFVRRKMKPLPISVLREKGEKKRD